MRVEQDSIASRQYNIYVASSKYGSILELSQCRSTENFLTMDILSTLLI